jgi:hypothetical protein
MFVPAKIHYDYILELPFGKSCVASYKKTKDAAFFFLHLLHVRRFLQKDKDAYIPISSIEMAQDCGKRPWGNAKNVLTKAGIVEINHRYQIGAKCKSYRLNHSWRNEVEWLLKEEPKNFAKQQFSYPIDKPEDGWGIDENKAKAAITHRYKDNKSQLDVYCHILENINDYDYCTVGKTGRQYTIYNGLPKETRQAIINNGKSTVELDVKNSQPLILASLCKDAAFKKAVEAGSFYDDCAEDFQLRRSEFKHKFIKWIGGAKDKQLDGYMMDRFPVMADYVITEKRKSYKGLICQLQTMEADIITTVPNSLSVHDGVRIKEEDKDLAEEHIRQGFGKLGLRPKIVTCG